MLSFLHVVEIIDNTNNVLLFLFQKGSFIHLYFSAIRSIIAITDLDSKLKFPIRHQLTHAIDSTVYLLSAFLPNSNLKIQNDERLLSPIVNGPQRLNPNTLATC